MKKISGNLVFSPSDLITYLSSPFASWMVRYELENPGTVTPDVATEDQRLIAETGDQHEQAVLAELKLSVPQLTTISKSDAEARTQTMAAINSTAPIIYQPALESGRFAGF